ncbi:VWA domain-containing protein [bacterium]|nr:VWA domain-containing protein [bacterium]
MKIIPQIVATILFAILPLGNSWAVEPWTLTTDVIDSTQLPQVTLAVTVTDANREGVLGLDSSHFSITTDITGSPMKPEVKSFYDSDQGVAVVLCLDVSLSMAGKPLEDMKKALSDYIDRLRAQDRVSIVTFGDKVEIVSDFSMNRDYLKERVAGINVAGSTTELFYGVFKGLDHLIQSPGIPSRRTILVLSDGKDESQSKAYSLADCVDKAKGAKIPISTIGFTKIEENYLLNLEAMSDRTGGRFHRARKSEDLSNQLTLSLDYMKSQYLLTYLTLNSLRDSRSHKYTVTASRANFAGQIVYSLIVPPAGPGTNADSSATNDESDATDMKMLAIIGAAVAGAIVLTLILFFVFRKRKKAKERHRKAEEERKSEASHRQIEEARIREEELKRQLEMKGALLSSGMTASPSAAEGDAGGRNVSKTGDSAQNSAAPKTQLVEAASRTPDRRTMIGDPNLTTYAGGKLVVLSGLQVGTEFDVSRPEVTIGASSDNTIILDEQTVSGHHAILRFAAGQFQLTDNKSTNGTSVNSTPIQTILLQDGDLIRLGRCELQFHGK